MFGPKSQQLDVYRAVVEPLIKQVMMVYNYTSLRLRTDRDGEDLHHGGWGNADEADSLEYSVRVSFLELYNE